MCWGRTRGSETSQYPEEKKKIAKRFFLTYNFTTYNFFVVGCLVVSWVYFASQNSLSSGERKGRSPNPAQTLDYSKTQFDAEGIESKVCAGGCKKITSPAVWREREST